MCIGNVLSKTEALIKLKIYLRINGTLVRNPNLQPFTSLTELYEQCRSKIFDGTEDPRLVEQVFNQLLIDSGMMN